MSTDGIIADSGVRTQTNFYQTAYYNVDGSFDFVEATVTCEQGTITGVIIPLWQHYEPSNKQMIFAVDFGTTNSHVEYAEQGRESQPLAFEESDAQTLVAT